ncbi:MAG: hypothetical protein ACJAZX_000500 [Rickettsiales bacterium]|jgi:hypothetical protein
MPIITPEDINPITGGIKQEVFEQLLNAELELDLSKHSWLVGTRTIRQQLSELEKSYIGAGSTFRLLWPPHFGNLKKTTAAKEKLNRIVDKYRKETGRENAGENLVLMLNRYMDGFTKLLDKTAAENVIGQVDSLLLNFLEKNPSAVKLMDGVALEYSDGCDNRPAFGFLIMTIHASILGQKSMSGAIKEGRKLLIVDSMIKFVDDKDFAESSGIEQGMNLLKDSEDLGRKDGLSETVSGVFCCFGGEEKVFKGIPKNIDENYKPDEEFILEFYAEHYKPIMEKSDLQIVEELCSKSHLRDNFAESVLPKEKLENMHTKIETEYSAKFEVIQKMIDREELTEEGKIDFDQKLSQEEKEIRDNFLPKANSGEIVQPENSSEFWQEKQIDLNNDKQSAIGEKLLNLIKATLENEKTSGNCISGIGRKLSDTVKALCPGGKNPSEESQIVVGRS